VKGGKKKKKRSLKLTRKNHPRLSAVEKIPRGLQTLWKGGWGHMDKKEKKEKGNGHVSRKT